MVKVIILLPKPIDEQEFERHYFTIHLPLVKKLPDVQSVVVYKAFDAVNLMTHIDLVAEFQFENEEVMKASLSSVEGQNVYKDAEYMSKFLPHSPHILFAETQE